MKKCCFFILFQKGELSSDIVKRNPEFLGDSKVPVYFKREFVNNTNVALKLHETFEILELIKSVLRWHRVGQELVAAQWQCHL